MFRPLLIILAVACCSFFIPTDNNTDKMVMKAAEGQLEAWLGKIQPGHAAEFGFVEGDDLENCGIAKPYRVLTFNSDFYSTPLAENTSYLTINNEWRAPVTVKGEHRVLLTVKGNSGNFSVTAMGDAELAKELEVKSAQFSDDNGYYILRVPAISAIFFVSEQNNSFAEAEFVPLESAYSGIPGLRNAKKTTFTLAEVQAAVKQAVVAQQEHKDPPKKKSVKKTVKKTAPKTIKKNEDE